MNECPRMNEVHPDATHPELYDATRPRACKIHIMSHMGNNKANFREHMDRVRDARNILNTKIGGIKTITDESKEEMHKAMEEFQDVMKPMERPENNCKPPSLYLPEFEKEFTDEPCPYMEVI